MRGRFAVKTDQYVDFASCFFFLAMPLKQMERMLALQNLKWLSQRSRGDPIRDVVDGIEHARLCADCLSNDISLFWNTDGISVRIYV